MPKPCCSEGSQLSSSEAADVDRLVDYVPDSIISRELIKNAAGIITLFAFDAGQGLSEHTAPFDALVHIVDGRSELVIGGKAITAVAGQMVLMPANVPHAVKAPQRFKMLLTMLRAKSSERSRFTDPDPRASR